MTDNKNMLVKIREELNERFGDQFINIINRVILDVSYK